MTPDPITKINRRIKTQKAKAADLKATTKPHTRNPAAEAYLAEARWLQKLIKDLGWTEPETRK